MRRRHDQTTERFSLAVHKHRGQSDEGFAGTTFRDCGSGPLATKLRKERGDWVLDTMQRGKGFNNPLCQLRTEFRNVIVDFVRNLRYVKEWDCGIFHK